MNFSDRLNLHKSFTVDKFHLESFVYTSEALKNIFLLIKKIPQKKRMKCVIKQVSRTLITVFIDRNKERKEKKHDNKIKM